MKIYSFDFEFDTDNSYNSRQMRFFQEYEAEFRVFYYIDDTNSLIIDHIRELHYNEWIMVDEALIHDDTMQIFKDAAYENYEFRRQEQIFKRYPTLNHTVEQLRELLGNDRKL